MLSVIIIAKNEEANIRRCLESVSWADQIVVLDSGSIDNTLGIAKEFTEEVYKTDWKGYGIQKQRALSFAKHDWVLNLDADEMVDVGLKHEILDAIESDDADAYRIPIRMIFYGKQLQFSASPTKHIRLFKREGAKYSSDIVHEKVLIPEGSRIARLKLPILHQSYRDITHALYKINRYSSYSARMRLKNNQRGGLFKMAFATGWMFFRCFILQRGFLDGKEGLIMALLKAQGSMVLGLKQMYPDRPLKRRTPPDKSQLSELNHNNNPDLEVNNSEEANHQSIEASQSQSRVENNTNTKLDIETDSSSDKVDELLSEKQTEDIRGSQHEKS